MNIQEKYEGIKKSSSRRFLHQLAKTEEELENEKSWMENNNVWVVHREGFTRAKHLQEVDDGRVRLQLDGNNEMIEVGMIEIANY